jgi:hypothetical protein
MENQQGIIAPKAQSAPQGGGVYPANKDEVQKFVAGIISSIHDDSTRDQIMSQLTNEQIPIQVRIGNVVSQIITAMLERVKKQAGRKPNLQLILKSIKMAVLEVAKMAEIAGAKSTPEERKQAAGIAGDLIESGQKGQMQGQQPIQGQPQGQPMQGQNPQAQQQQPPQQGM